MTVKINDSLRHALVAVALCDIGIGFILLGTVGLGSFSSTLRDIIGWLLIAQAIPNALQAIYGTLHRAGEELLLVNVGFIGFAWYQILVSGNAPHTVATIGQAVMIFAVWLACTVLWAHVSGRRLGRQHRHARTSRGKDHP